MLPDFIRRRFVIRKQTLYPNVKRGMFSRILSDGNTLATITKGVVADASSQVCTVGWAQFHKNNDTLKAHS